MAKQFQFTVLQRVERLFFLSFLRLGLPMGTMVILTVPGRRSGKLHSNPVDPIEWNGERWLVAPYGAVQWVRNARASGWVILSHGRKSEKVRVVEPGIQEAAQVLKQYNTRGCYSRPYFDTTPDSTMEAFIAEAPHHPVFRIVPLEAAA